MFINKQDEFKSWVKLYSDALYAYVARRGFDGDAGKDIVQDAFIAAWRNINNFKGEASVKNWLFVILKSKIADHFRKSANKIEMETIRTDHTDQAFFDEDDHWKKGMYPKHWHVNFSDKLEAKEFNKVFLSCGRKLKQVQHTVFVMKYVDGLESDEICKELNISSSNYWVLIHRAKVQLRACLEKHWL